MWASEQAEKDRFAGEWLRQSDPWKAAVTVAGVGNPSKALKLSVEWVNDPYVIAKKAELLEEQGEDAFLPSKAELARKVLEVHDKSHFPEDRLKALRLFGEVMGYIAKPGANSDGKAPVIVTVSETDLNL